MMLQALLLLLVLRLKGCHTTEVKSIPMLPISLTTKYTWALHPLCSTEDDLSTLKQGDEEAISKPSYPILQSNRRDVPVLRLLYTARAMPDCKWAFRKSHLQLLNEYNQSQIHNFPLRLPTLVVVLERRCENRCNSQPTVGLPWFRCEGEQWQCVVCKTSVNYYFDIASNPSRPSRVILVCKFSVKPNADWLCHTVGFGCRSLTLKSDWTLHNGNHCVSGCPSPY